jgi:amidohydrolase
MDALPVIEQGDLPFKSITKTQWNGQEVGVMHACGHDNHMAILLGAATALARMKDRLPGTVKVIFQPAEEGLPPGEVGGAEQMVKEGVLENPKVDATRRPGAESIPLSLVRRSSWDCRPSSAAT